MRKIITTLLILVSLNVNPQYLINQVEPPTKLVLKDDGWFTISLGTLIIATSYYTHNSGVSNKAIVTGLIFTTTIGVGFYIISWKRVHKYNTVPKY